MILPNLVTEFSFIKWEAFEGVFVFMVLNFKSLNGFLCIPTLSCINIGLPDSKKQIVNIKIINGLKPRNSNVENKIS